MSLPSKLLLAGATLALVSCTGVPSGVTPVTPFDLNRYLGQWHEIARQDHRFERGLTQVTAQYSLRPDGTVAVLNRGYAAAEQQWQEADGVARFVDDSPAGRQQGRLKVSFFGPFYGAYNIVKLADDYSMALVVGPDLSYAWLLARSANPTAAQCAAFYQYSADIGIAEQSWIKLAECNG